MECTTVGYAINFIVGYTLTKATWSILKLSFVSLRISETFTRYVGDYYVGLSSGIDRLRLLVHETMISIERVDDEPS